MDNSTHQPRGSPGHDHLGKVHPIIDHLSAKFAEAYDLHKEVAVDKVMIKFQGRSSLKQYIPKKPVKCGIKVWVLEDSEMDTSPNLISTAAREHLQRRV